MIEVNLNAKMHPCMKCEHGRVWTEQQKPNGNSCHHPNIVNKNGLLYGRFHTYKCIPSWCPLKTVD